jgi:hypothetical protein
MASPALLDAFDRQVAWCAAPAPFTAKVLALSRLWLQQDTAAAAAFDAVADDPAASAVPLRWAAALHHLAFQGAQPWSSLWPPASDLLDVSAGQLGNAIELAWALHRPQMQAALASPLTLHSDWRGPAPALAAAPLRIVRRAGCDARPVDLAQADDSLRLAS